MIAGINQAFKSDVLKDALKRSGFKVRVRRTRWPRTKGCCTRREGGIKNLHFLVEEKQ